jgi:signal peptidase I
MLSAVRNRRSWVAALVVLFLTPVVGMAYLNRGWLALLYLLLLLAIALGVAALYPQGLDATLLAAAQYAVLGVVLAALLHAIWIAYWYDPSRRLRWYARHWILIALFLALLPVAAWGLRVYAYQPFTATSNSMIPSILFRDQLLVSKFQERDFSPQRGDVVLFRTSAMAGPMIKRVVGMPGDSIQMQGGVLFVNGVRVFLRLMPDVMAPCGDGTCPVRRFEENLPGGHKAPILNRESSGTSDNTDLYIVPENGYFVLGDDRDNSLDSRHTGPVLRQDLIGRVIARYIVEGRWTWQPVN